MPQTIEQRPYYRLEFKVGWMFTDLAGRVIHDVDVGRDYRPAEPSDSWKILGIGRRFQSHRLVTLADAAAGAAIGQGWVHDLDHGTHRVWGMPKHRRCIRVELQHGLP